MSITTRAARIAWADPVFALLARASAILTLSLLVGIIISLVIGAWPATPELVHWANLTELLPNLFGVLPAGAGAMDPGVFRRSAPGWLTPALYGVLDDWRSWAEDSA